MQLHYIKSVLLYFLPICRRLHAQVAVKWWLSWCRHASRVATESMAAYTNITSDVSLPIGAQAEMDGCGVFAPPQSGSDETKGPGSPQTRYERRDETFLSGHRWKWQGASRPPMPSRSIWRWDGFWRPLFFLNFPKSPSWLIITSRNLQALEPINKESFLFSFLL